MVVQRRWGDAGADVPVTGGRDFNDVDVCVAEMAETKGNVLKVRLGNDTRRQVLYNTNISYNDLVLMLQRFFEGKLKPTDDVTLKYFDEG